MKLKSVEFYQSVRLWDNSEYKSVHSGERFSVNLVDHLVLISCEGEADTVVVPTANMRHGKIGPEEKQEPIDPTPLVESSGAPEVVETFPAAFIPEGSTVVETAPNKCPKHCTFSRAMNQPIPRLCTKCGSPEEPKTK